MYKMNKVYKKYISSIEALFPVKGKAEKKYLDNFKINVLDYVEENNVTSMDVLNDEFGTPSEVVNTYFSSVDTEYVVKRVKHSKWLKLSFITILIAVVIGIGIYAAARVMEYIAFMEEKVAITDVTDNSVDVSEYTEGQWKKYSTITKFVELPVGEGQYIEEYKFYTDDLREIPRQLEYVVLDDCRVAILDRWGEQLLICDSNNNIQKISVDTSIENIWCKNGQLYLADGENIVYEVIGDTLVKNDNEREDIKDFTKEEELIWQDKEKSTLSVIGKSTNGDIYTYENIYMITDAGLAVENAIRRYDSAGNILEYAYFDSSDCAREEEDPVYIDNNGNIWLMLCKHNSINIYLVTLGNADESIANELANMRENYDDFMYSTAIDCEESGISLNELKGKYRDAYTYDKTQIELGRNTKFVTTSRTLHLKNADENDIIELTVTATFAYDGNIARCIGIAPDAKTYASGWTIEKYETTNDVGKAMVTAVFVHEGQDGDAKKYTSSVTIYCGPNGKIH